MGYKLYREIMDNAPGWDSGMMVVALVIADDANDDTRKSWIPLDKLTHRTKLQGSGVSRALRRLAAAGYEFRIPHGKNRNGDPVFAMKGYAVNYLIPAMPDPQSGLNESKPDPQSGHSSSMPDPQVLKPDPQSDPSPHIPSETPQGHIGKGGGYADAPPELRLVHEKKHHAATPVSRAASPVKCTCFMDENMEQVICGAPHRCGCGELAQRDEKLRYINREPWLLFTCHDHYVMMSEFTEAQQLATFRKYGIALSERVAA